VALLSSQSTWIKITAKDSPKYLELAYAMQANRSADLLEVVINQWAHGSPPFRRWLTIFYSDRG
jgi:hypothetical protein